MKKLTLIDFTVRLQLISCCFAEKACELVSQMHLGLACEEAIEKLKIMATSIEVLKCYTVDDTLTKDEESALNTITYEQMEGIINMFIEECGLCLQPAGTEYVDCDE